MRELNYMINLDIVPLIDMNLPTEVRHNKLPGSIINPKLIELLGEVDLSLSGSGIFYSPPGFKTEIFHTDCFITDHYSDWPSIAKLNFVVGEENTLALWADVPVKYRLLSSSNKTDINQEYQAYHKRRCENIVEYKLNGCFLFEAGIPHTVRNPTENPKWTISFVLHNLGFWDPISFNEAKSKLKKLCLKN